MPFTHPDFEGARQAVRREMLSPETAIHPDEVAVEALAALMKAKLAKQRGKGYGGWDTDCTQQRLSELLRSHVDKGDPVDVANFCAFLSARGEGISPDARLAAAQAEIAKLRGAFSALELSANTVARCYTHRPENFAAALQSLEADAAAARELLK